jgi:hypothetical protein
LLFGAEKKIGTLSSSAPMRIRVGGNSHNTLNLKEKYKVDSGGMI